MLKWTSSKGLKLCDLARAVIDMAEVPAEKAQAGGSVTLGGHVYGRQELLNELRGMVDDYEKSFPIAIGETKEAHRLVQHTGDVHDSGSGGERSPGSDAGPA